MTKRISKISFTIISLILLVLFIFECQSYGASNDTSIRKIEVSPCINNLQQDSGNSNIYRVAVNNSVTSVNVNIEPNDSSASVSVQGNTGLDVGTNKVEIKITAEDGNSDSYIIYVRRLSKEIADTTITPNVQEEKQEFIKPDSSEIQLADADSTVDDGENVLEINTIIEDSDEESEENIIVENLENDTAKWENNIFDDNSKRRLLIVGLVMLSLIIISIIVIITINKKKYKSRH